MNAEVSIIADRLPVQPAVCVECKAATAALMTSVGCACGVTKAHGPAQAIAASSRKSPTAISAKSSIPICRRQTDEHFHSISGGRMRDRCRDATGSVGRIDGGGIDRGVRKRNLGQTLARTNGRGVCKQRLWRRILLLRIGGLGIARRYGRIAQHRRKDFCYQWGMNQANQGESCLHRNDWRVTGN